MKQRALLFSLAAGAACLALRLLQNHIGFEADTRLPVPGSLPALLLPLLLLLSAAALILLTRRLPRSTEAPFSAQFGGADAKCLTLTVLGCFLVGLSGVWELLRAVSGGQAVLSADGLSVVTSAGSGTSGAIMGVLSIAAAAGLFCGLLACRKETVSPLPLLAVPVSLLIRLVFVYRLDSVDPVLAHYYPELLGLMALILGSYRLSGFTVKAGNPRLFTLYTGLSVICSLTLLADGITPAACLTLGGAAALAGFCWTMREAA